MLTRTCHLSPSWTSVTQLTHIHHILMFFYRRLNLQGVSSFRFFYDIFLCIFLLSHFCFVSPSPPPLPPISRGQPTCTRQSSACHEAPCYTILPIILLLSLFKHLRGVTNWRRRKEDIWRPPSVMALFRTALVPAWDYRKKTDSHPCVFWGWNFSFVSWPIQVTSPTTFWTHS
jgi:hypothetical protein